MKRVIVFITLALLTISCIFICLLLFGRYSVEIAYVLTKAGVLSTIDSSQQTSPNAPILSDTFLTDKEYISYSTRDAYNTDVNKMSKGITAIDPDGNRFAIEKDFIEAKRRYLESKGVYINYPYIDTFHHCCPNVNRTIATVYGRYHPECYRYVVKAPAKGAFSRRA